MENYVESSKEFIDLQKAINNGEFEKHCDELKEKLK